MKDSPLNTLNPFSKGSDEKFVDVIRGVLGGHAYDEVEKEEEEEVKTEKVDGRTKNYKTAVKRMSDGGRRKGDGIDCRTKGYKATVARIAARASTKPDAVVTKEANENFLTEKLSDIEFVIDQLANSMEFFDEDEFVEFISSQTNISEDVLRTIYQDYQKLSAQVKNQNAYGWEKWLEGYGIKESVEERYDSPSYRGRPTTVRSGVAMSDEGLGRMRIMMRNISKFEGVDVLANEISSALSSSEIQELKRLL